MGGIMAKSLLKLKAIHLRQQGLSIKTIAKQLGVAKSTASAWTHDVDLTSIQMEQLRNNKIKGAETGRLKGTQTIKMRKQRKIEDGLKKGIATIKELSNDQFFIAGLCLYWAEGNKKSRKIEFCNSDPKLVQFMITWLQKFFLLTTKDLSCYVGINEYHKNRDLEVKEYWNKVTNIPISQFTKTSFKHVRRHKRYWNETNHFGTLSVKVKNPSRFIYELFGYIERLRTILLPG